MFSEKYQSLRVKKIDQMGNFIKPIFLALEQEMHFQTDPAIQNRIHNFLMELMKCKIAGPNINDKATVFLYGPDAKPHFGSYHLLQPLIIFSDETKNALEKVAEPLWLNQYKTTSRAKSSARYNLENILLGRKPDDYHKWVEFENKFGDTQNNYQQSLNSIQNSLSEIQHLSSQAQDLQNTINQLQQAYASVHGLQN